MPHVINPFLDFRAAFESLAGNISRFTSRSVQTQLGRSVIAVAQLLTLVLTDWRNLTAQVLGRPAEGYCEGVRTVSVFCLGSSTPIELGRWIGIAITLIVVSGLFPRYTAVLHAWLAISMSVSLSLPDGGDSVAVFSTTLLIAVLIGDDRVNGWHPSRIGNQGSALTAISYAGSLALCLQLAGIYLESGLSKLAVEDWVNGSAMYYITRDPMFGSVGLVGEVMHWVTALPFGTALLTWGSIFLECAIAVLLLCQSRLKRYGLVGVVVLHLLIAITMGLWSFALIMIGTAVVAAYSFRPGRDVCGGLRAVAEDPAQNPKNLTGRELARS